MAYKNLFFDLDDTLWAFTQNARDTFEELYDKYRYDRFSILSNITIRSISSTTWSCGLHTGAGS